MTHDLTAFCVQLADLVAKYRTPLLFLSSAALGAAGAWLIGCMPLRKRLMDTPNERSSHAIPTPRGAGIGILAAFVLAGLTLRMPMTFILAAALISLVSFCGDYTRISVRFRLALQILSTTIFMVPLLPGPIAYFASSTSGPFPFPSVLILPFIFIFMIGTANFYNFMDGIDGMAGLCGAIGFGLLGCYTLFRIPVDSFQTSLSLLAICISLACLGYLPFNMPRARVFMGDVGSILLGFVFAGLAILLSRSYLETACFAALLFPFYADELTTLAIRLQSRENLAQSHRRHLYQLLANELGIAHWKVSSLYGTAQFIIGTGVLLAYSHGAWAALILLTACFLGFTALTAYIRKIA